MTNEQDDPEHPGTPKPVKAAKPRKAAAPKKTVAPKKTAARRKAAAPDVAEEPEAVAEPQAAARPEPAAEPDEVAELDVSAGSDEAEPESATAPDEAAELDEATAVDAQDAAPDTRPSDAPSPADDDEDETAETPEGERIAKAIARAGIASRRDVEAMILEGRVSVNGRVIASPALNVTDADRIVVDGEPLPARERTRLWLLHKPRGVVTTARDPEKRQTVFDMLPEDLPRVVAIGRLDINTEGLLLLTNDGGLAKVIAHPDTGWLRRYRVRAFGEINQADLDKLRGGVTIDGMSYGPIEAKLDRAQGDNVWLTLGLREGKNREVKRILEYLGLSVNRLIRVSFGPFQLGDLEMGLVEEIRTKVLKEQLGATLSEQAGVDFTSPVREPIAAFGKPPKAAKQAEARPARSGSRPERAPSPRGRDGARPQRDGGRLQRDGDRSVGPSRGGVPARGAGAKGPAAKNAPERSTTWHAEDALRSGTGTRIPRRGSDPKQARAASAERGRERVGAIKTGERRVLVERLQPTPQAGAPEPKRRGPPRGDATMRRERPDARGQGERTSERTGERRFERPQGGDRSEGRGERGGFQGRGGERGGDRGGFQPRGERPSGGAGAGRGAPRSGGFRGADRDGGAQPRGERPARDGAPRGERAPGGYKGGEGRSDRGGFKTGKPGEARSGGGAGFEKRPGGFSGGKPGGRSGAGGKPSGGFAGKPGGFGGKPGGFGGKPGGRSAAPGGGKPGGRPGGFGGKPGGRPSGGKPGGGASGGGRPGPRGGGGGRPPRSGG